MNTRSIYPSSFPNADEELFLRLVLCRNIEFAALYTQWKNSIVFDEIDHATMRLLPLLYLRLKEFPIEDEISGRIKGTYRLAWYKNQQMLDTTKQVVSLLQENGIPSMLMKGIPLLSIAYKNTGARFLGDVDLYIQPEHVTSAIELLRIHGWISQERILSSTTDFSSNVLNLFNEITFQNAHSVELDLHWSIFKPRFHYTFPDSFRSITHPMLLEHVWNHSVPFTIQSAACVVPCPEDMLIHLIVHGAEFNSYHTLRWIVDAMYLIKNTNIDWNRVLARTKQFDCVVEMKIAMSYLAEKFDAQIPESFLKSLQSIEINTSTRKRYQYSTTVHSSFSLLVDAFILWRLYKKNVKALSFLSFLGKQFNVTDNRDMIPFLLQKFQKRFHQRINTTKEKTNVT